MNYRQRFCRPLTGKRLGTLRADRRLSGEKPFDPLAERNGLQRNRHATRRRRDNGSNEHRQCRQHDGKDHKQQNVFGGRVEHSIRSEVVASDSQLNSGSMQGAARLLHTLKNEAV